LTWLLNHAKIRQFIKAGKEFGVNLLKSNTFFNFVFLFDGVCQAPSFIIAKG